MVGCGGTWNGGSAETVSGKGYYCNISSDGVVISIGYSVLTDEDEQLHDVFERADNMMYQRKQELKAMGARTRD